MRVHTNTALLKRRSRVSGAFLASALGLLILGMFASFIGPTPQIQLGASTVALVVGLFLWSRNQTYLNKWGLRTRQDGHLSTALKGLDDRYHLLVAPGPNLPDYLLIGPMGAL